MTTTPSGEMFAKGLRDAYGRGFSRGYYATHPSDVHDKLLFMDERDAWIRQYMARMPVAVPEGRRETPEPSPQSSPTLKTGMTVEEGAYYQNAAGERVGPMHRIKGDAAQVWYARSHKGDWLPDGRALHSSPQDNLVAEWPAATESAR